MSPSTRSWKKKLPPQFLFWLEAVGLEVVLAQPEDITAFALEYFDRQLARRSAELVNVPTHGYFHDIFAKRIRDKRFSSSTKNAGIALKYSSHAYNLDDVYRRDSLAANITCPDDDLEYKMSVEKVMKRRQEDMVTTSSELEHTSAEVYVPHYDPEDSGGSAVIVDVGEGEVQEQDVTGEKPVSIDENEVQDKVVPGEKPMSIDADEVQDKDLPGEKPVSIDEHEVQDENIPGEKPVSIDANEVQDKVVPGEKPMSIDENEVQHKDVPGETPVFINEGEFQQGDVPGAMPAAVCEGQVRQEDIPGEMPLSIHEGVIHREEDIADVGWDDTTSIAVENPRRSTMNIIENNATNSAHSCNPFEINGELCVVCGKEKVKMVMEGESQTKEIETSDKLVGDSDELPNTDLFAPAGAETHADFAKPEVELLQENAMQQTDDINETANAYDCSGGDRTQSPGNESCGAQKFAQSTFSDNPTPGVNVTGTISVAKTKKQKDHEGPVTVEVLAEADDEQNDVIDVEINLHCHCTT